MKSIRKGNEESADVCVYDVDKGFDALWTYEYIHDIYEAGFQNDKLPLLFLENKSAQVVINTA